MPVNMFKCVQHTGNASLTYVYVLLTCLFVSECNEIISTGLAIITL